MAVIPVTAERIQYLTAIDLTSAALTVFTADGIQWTGSGNNMAFFENTGASPNTVRITAYQTSAEGFPISDFDFVIPATSQIATGKIGNVIAGNQITATVVGTPTEVKYKVLNLA